MRVLNRTRETMVADAAIVADTSQKRRTGLLKHTSLPAGKGLWISPCEAVHTFGMKFAIDIVFLDKQRRVRKIGDAVRPRRLAACLSAHSVLELPAGRARETRMEVGDQLEFEKLGT